MRAFPDGLVVLLTYLPSCHETSDLWRSGCMKTEGPSVTPQVLLSPFAKRFLRALDQMDA